MTDTAPILGKAVIRIYNGKRKPLEDMIINLASKGIQVTALKVEFTD